MPDLSQADLAFLDRFRLGAIVRRNREPRTHQKAAQMCRQGFLSVSWGTGSGDPTYRATGAAIRLLHARDGNAPAAVPGWPEATTRQPADAGEGGRR